MSGVCLCGKIAGALEGGCSAYQGVSCARVALDTSYICVAVDGLEGLISDLDLIMELRRFLVDDSGGMLYVIEPLFPAGLAE